MTSQVPRRTGIRAVALFMAALYMILCTAGALLHRHPAFSASSVYSGSLSGDHACALHRAGHSGASLNAHLGGTLYDASHCAYCEWQAGNVWYAGSETRPCTPELSCNLLASFGPHTHGLLRAQQPGCRAPPRLA